MNIHPRPFLLFITLAALSALSGCWTYSLQPLYSDNDPNLAYEPALDGTWKNESNESISITGDSKSQTYRLEWVREGSSAGPQPHIDFDFTYSGRLVQLGADRFLDAVPEGDGIAGSLPAHNVFKISVDDDTLVLSPLNVEWLCSARKPIGRRLGSALVATSF